jgi:hypothetical protein
MSERRKIERKYLIYYLRVFDRSTNLFMGNLVDITTDGIMVMSETPIKQNTVFTLAMDLPEPICGCKRVTFDAKSIRCEQDPNPVFYNTGFQFVAIENGDVETIRTLIEEFSISDPGNIRD